MSTLLKGIAFACLFFFSSSSFASSELSNLSQSLFHQRGIIEIQSSEFDFSDVYEIDVNRARMGRARKGLKARRMKTIR